MTDGGEVAPDDVPDVPARPVRPGRRGPLRRRPVQQRSAARLERILDAAAALLDEDGYEALTTTRIAHRAGVPVGSVYHFFPDKRAAVAALTQRYLTAFETAAAAALDADRPRSWEGVVEVLVRTYRDMHTDVPGFARVHFGDRVDDHLLDGTRTNNAVVAAGLVTLVARTFAIAPDRLALPVRVAVEAVDGLFQQAFRAGAEEADALLTETRVLLAGYLAERLGPLGGR